MSSWHVVGLATDHGTSPQAIIRDFVQSNWSLTGDLAVGIVRFSTRWYNKQMQFQICFRHDIHRSVKKKTIGSSPITEFDDLVDVHCFVEEQTDNDEPVNIDKMNNELQRIIGSDITALEATQGICNLSIDSTPRVLPVEAIDSQSTVHHSIVRIGLIYRKVYS